MADASLILEQITSVSWLDWGRRLLPGLTREVEKQLRQMQGRTRSDSDDERRRLRQEEKLDLFIAGAITQSAYENNSDQSDVEMGDAEEDQLAVEEPESAHDSVNLARYLRETDFYGIAQIAGQPTSAD